MSKIEIDELKELFAEWGLWSLVDDISPDGDGHGDNLELTREGLEAKRMINQLLEDKEAEVLQGLKLRLNDCVVYINDNGEIDHGVINSVNREIDKLLGEERDEDN